MSASFALPSRPWIVALALACAAPAFAQGNAPEDALLRPARMPNAELPPQAERGTGIVGDFNARALEAHRIRLSLPDGRELRAVRGSQVRDARLGETWAGEFEGAPGSLLVLTRHRGAVTGFLHHGADVYEIMPRRGGRQMLYRVDPARIPPDSEPLPAPAGAANQVADYGAGAAATTAASGIVQDLLVVYTPASVSRAGSEATLQSQIANAVAAANTAYANSQIGITLNVVGMALTQYTETGDMGVALSALRATADGQMDEVHALRDQTGADLVALINEDANYCGIAYVMTSVGSSFASYAFGVTARNCLSNQTLAHEIGHNQGNQHDRETVAANGGGSGAYPYSFGYRRCVTGGFRTVMSYSCTGATRVSHFSNPSVLYNGEVTGIAYESDPANSADNARSMGNTAAVIAGLRAGAVTAPPAAPSGLGVTPASSTSLTLRWTDHAGDEAGFEAWRSDSGAAGTFQRVATLGANATAWTDNTLAPLTTRWYQVRAYNAAGSSAFTSAASAQTFEAPPSAPTAVSAAYDAALASVAIGWTDGAGTETAFEVRRETLNARKGTWGSAVTVASVGAGARSYADKPAGGTYRYSVRGVNAGGSSPWSAPSASATVPGSTGKGRR